MIEVARRAAGLSQRRLSELARTQQSSVSEYESRRKSPTLEVVERLLDAANAELAVKPMVFFEYRKDPEIGSFAVPDRLWSVPVPECFARVQVLKYIFHTDDNLIWDLSDPTERIEYYELALVHGLDEMLLDSVDGVLLIQAWPHMHLPDVVREAWQPVIDAPLHRRTSSHVTRAGSAPGLQSRSASPGHPAPHGGAVASVTCPGRRS